jgi:hypothetical protein
VKKQYDVPTELTYKADSRTTRKATERLVKLRVSPIIMVEFYIGVKILGKYRRVERGQMYALRNGSRLKVRYQDNRDS